MTFQIALLFIMLGAALVLFALERIPPDVVALSLLAALTLTGLLPYDQAFTGFSNSAVITLLGLFILTEALMRTGVVSIFGRTILRGTRDKPERILAIVLIASSVIGAFMSNTASTAFFIPVVLGIARRTSTSPSRLLMPLAFASILSSSVTLISTSTNIVVSGLMSRYQMSPIGMFEMAPVGIPIMVAGLVYMYYLGPRLIPDRAPATDPAQDPASQNYLTEVVILPDSSLAGKRLDESVFVQDLDLNVVQVIRDQVHYIRPRPQLRLHEGDELLVEGPRDEIIDIKSTAGIDIKADANLTDPNEDVEKTRLVEGIVLVRSPLINRTLKRVRFRERYRVQVLAIHRRGQAIRNKMSEIPLQVGDVLLLQGPADSLNAMNADGAVRIIGDQEERPPLPRRAPLAIAAFAGALILGSTNVVPFSMAMILGVLAVFLTRILTPQEAYRNVEWRALVLIASMIGAGAAMDYTGAAEWLASRLVDLLSGVNPVWLLTVFFALTVLLTQPMSNQAAAVVVVPIAIQTALQVNLNPRTFAIMIAVAASTSYLTPLEPSCLMVYGPGRYRFSDFLKVGSLLTVLIYLIAIVLVPFFWPLS